MLSYAVPAFRTDALIAWGPLPAGTPHPERARIYDLQHQVVHVRFDWPRHAVVGSTTIRVAALDKPLTAIPLDAVGMTIQKVSAPNGARLRYDYDGSTLTVKLPGTLRPRSNTTFVVDYEAVRPKKGAYFIDRRHVVWTQGETEDNRYWVPTWDFPNDRRPGSSTSRRIPARRRFPTARSAGNRGASATSSNGTGCSTSPTRRT